MIRRKAFKFRLKPNKSVEDALLRFAGCNRFVWNKALALQKERLDKNEYTLLYYKLAPELMRWKDEEQTAFLKECPSQTLQQTLLNLDRALKDAFNKTSSKRFPQFKKKGKHDSFRYPQGIKLDGNQVFLPKIGWVRFFKSREVVGTIKNATVSRRGTHWFVSIQTEQDIETSKYPSKSIVGIDVGIKKFAVLSNGAVFEPLNSFKQRAKRLASEQKALARKQRGSNNFKKQKARVTKLHTKIADARLDYLHKTSTTISKNHACVVLEDLKVANMSHSAKGDEHNPGKNVKAKSGLNRSILDQGWHTFKNLLGYKLNWLGGEQILVDAKYTSQRCSACGHTAPDNRMSQASFCCVACGQHENADLNAARNILAAGHAVLACGDISPVWARAQESLVL